MQYSDGKNVRGLVREVQPDGLRVVVVGGDRQHVQSRHPNVQAGAQVQLGRHQPPPRASGPRRVDGAVGQKMRLLRHVLSGTEIDKIISILLIKLMA